MGNAEPYIPTNPDAYPRVETVTAIGSVIVQAASAEKVFIRHADQEEGVCINKVTCSLRCSLTRRSDGTWGLPLHKETGQPEYHELSVHRLTGFRPNGGYDDSVSDSARRKALVACLSAVEDAIRGNPSLLSHADYVQREWEKDTLKTRIAFHEEKAEELRAQLESLA